MTEKLRIALAELQAELDAALDIVNNSGVAGTIFDRLAERLESARRLAAEMRKCPAEQDDHDA